MVSFAPEHTSIWEIPFPAVTVCPLIKVKQDKFNLNSFKDNDTLFEELWNITEIRKKFWDLSFLCGLNLGAIASDPEDISDEDVITNIKMVSPSLEDTVMFTEWPNQFYAGSFAPHITSEGLCFTANAFGHYDMYTEQMKEGVHFIEHNGWINTNANWSMDNGYTTTDEESSYPVRTAQAGLNYSLSFLLFSTAEDRTKYCGDDTAGYKMVLHNPAEIPKLSENYFFVPLNKKVIVAVTPKVIGTSKDLEHIPAHSRNCYFDHEKKLRFFKIYTQHNCKIECISNVTRQYCGCLPFYLPRDKNTEICGYGKIDCLGDAKDLVFKYLNMANQKKIDIDNSEKREYEIFEQCDCLSSCNYIDYEADISQAEYNENDQGRHGWGFFTPMDIFFKESQFLSLERNELYGQTDFIANIGGLLGLCMGFSFLSLLEIIYFITLRVWCTIYRKNKIAVGENSNTRVEWLN